MPARRQVTELLAMTGCMTFYEWVKIKNKKGRGFFAPTAFDPATCLYCLAIQDQEQWASLLGTVVPTKALTPISF